MFEETERQLLKFLRSLAKDSTEEIIIEDAEMDCIPDSIKAELEKFSLLSLQLNKCKLKSLSNLPDSKSIIRVCLDHNQLSGKELSKLNIYPNLVALSIMDNQFDSIEDIKQLALLNHLSQLNVYRNPVADQPKFRQETFEVLSKLVLLDNLSKTGDEIQLNEEVKISKNLETIDPSDQRKIIG
ncbi:unnamed protein product (macronuclear) [Paramecium tetraurelia]|uniref:U2A'/phosphoprotein 32 family A C-terminal domain-containing protein n=2 Tax=Paramecium TaxID=5884 RepID=A0BWP9_PARTE|nr:uncharacterized protein GSPATT00032818001 [Paramecium tetraurelia]CAD8186991.1 unnamed protein product [Paramecium octaurelia]CAK62966.1 unnamed protein product [Paramecium tetraurelia]|eukprot:XP_001430364.1 hypothetical protein (macronuclear) [Paramecium tetraurelia strain d4-2]